jgi:hypothetical protein
MLKKALVLLAAPMALAFAPASPALRAHQSCAAARGPLSAAAPACRAAAPGRAWRMAAVESTARSAGLEALKSDLMTKLSVGSGLKGAADSANRADINEMVLKLETQNPTSEPAESPLLNGVWELLYTGGYAAPVPWQTQLFCARADLACCYARPVGDGWCACGSLLVRTGRYGMGFFDSPTREIALALYTGGFRAGLLANFVSKLPGPLATVVELNDVELSIKREQPRVEASASVVVVGSEQKLSLKGELKATSAVRLEETLVKANFFGQSTDLQVCPRSSRRRQRHRDMGTDRQTDMCGGMRAVYGDK